MRPFSAFPTSALLRTLRTGAGLAAAALAGAWLLPGTLQAQEADGFPRSPSMALGVVGGTVVGVWLPMGERAQVGAEIGLGWNRQGGTESGGDAFRTWGATLNLPVKVPLAGDGAGAGPALVPYIVAGPQFGVSRGQARTESTSMGAFAGAGLDWFPVPRVSVGGHVGASVNRRRMDHRGIDEFGNLTTTSHRIDWALATLSSGIRVHLYLR